jgi:hypothetical protein
MPACEAIRDSLEPEAGFVQIPHPAA